MAIPTNAFTTYPAIGNREDLIDVITMISPTKTPVLSMTESTRATATLHEWLTDTLAAPAANAQLEGDDATAVAVVAAARVNNYTQVLTKRYTVSNTQEAVNKAGRSSEIGWQTQKALKELANDIEYAFVVNASAVAGATNTARQLKGITGWITTNINSATANRALTTVILDNVLSLAWAQGGDPDVLLCGGNQKIAIAGFTGNTREIAAEAAKVVNSIDVYQSSFGTTKVVLSHVMNTNLANSVYALDMSYWRKAWLRPITKDELAKTGDARKFLVVAEVTLESLNEKASGAAKNLT